MTPIRALRAGAILTALALGLSACSSIPRERTSPCACDWRPLTQTDEATA